MNVQEFFELLKNHTNKSLLFEYMPNKFVDTNYHITEVKHITVDSVDCGAQTDTWFETIIQLWESPLEKGKADYMSVYSAYGILKKVDKIKNYHLTSEVKFEYHNSNFHTAQLFVSDFEIRGNNLVIKLAIEKTDCKAKELCGVPETVNEETKKTKSSCAPGSGCC